MFFLAVINLTVSLVLGYKIRAFILRLYLVVNYVLIVQPYLLETLFGLVHPRHTLRPETYQEVLLFTLCFNLTIAFSFLLSIYRIPAISTLLRFKRVNRADRAHRADRVFVACLVLFCVSIGAKWLLNTYGAYRMLEGGQQNSPFLQLIKVVALFDLFVLLFLGEFKARHVGDQFALGAIYICLAAVAGLLAIWSGSRSQVATVLVVTLISHRKLIRRYSLLFVSLAIPASPIAFILFPFLAYYRSTQYNWNRTVDRLGQLWSETEEIMQSVLTTRLNYAEPIAHAVHYVKGFQPNGGAVYWNNLLGLIPRLVWPDKPQISNDSHVLGHLLGLVTRDDISTSIGLRPIGEAYFELAWIGLVVAVLQGFLFALLHAQFAQRSSASLYTIYLYLSIYLVQRDGFFAVLPGLVYLGIAFLIFFGLMMLLLPTAPTRPSHRCKSAMLLRT